MDSNLNNNIFIALSTNLGDKFTNLQDAIKLLQTAEIKIIATSSIYETEAWGFENQENFYNQCLEISTNLSPENLLSTLQAIENKLGRIKEFKYGPRLIDLDILYYQQLILDSQDLQIPHPHNADRNFVLVPLAEIAPNFLDPKLKITINNLKIQCLDTKQVKKVN